MGRPVNTDHRQALLEAAASHLVDHGVAGASLSDIAAGAGTSARMLVHHFGTRDALVARGLAIARQWQLDEAQSSFQPGPDAVAVLRATWPWLVDDRTQSYFRLFQQVAALERLQGPDASTDFSARLGADWRPMLTGVFVADPRYGGDAQTLADLTIAFYRGLAIDLASAPDRLRYRPTFDRFIKLLEADRRTPGRGGGSRPRGGRGGPPRGG
jgi:AcrR family transcriptional regulator